MTEQHECEWEMDKYRENSACCIFEGCNRGLDSIDILRRLNEYETLKRAVERLLRQEYMNEDHRLGGIGVTYEQFVDNYLANILEGK